jgi:hypothetical protein
MIEIGLLFEEETLSLIPFHHDGLPPLPNQIFVYGSNLSGIHGAGAARAAFDFYGAKWGYGLSGVIGNSYAIPTKDELIQSLTLSKIRVYVDEFKKFAKDNPDIEFFVTRIGCGYAGYKDEDIAPMFKGISVNCDMPLDWKRYL